jgi:hypothetical protein
VRAGQCRERGWGIGTQGVARVLGSGRIRRYRPVLDATLCRAPGALPTAAISSNWGRLRKHHRTITSTTIATHVHGVTAADAQAARVSTVGAGLPGSTIPCHGDERGKQGGDAVVVGGEVEGRNDRRRWRRGRGFGEDASEERDERVGERRVLSCLCVRAG